MVDTVADLVTVVTGDEVHASALKGLQLAGFGRDQVIRVPTDECNRFSNLRQRFCNSIGKRLAFNQQLRLVSSHSSGGAACEDKGFHIGTGLSCKS